MQDVKPLRKKLNSPNMKWLAISLFYLGGCLLSSVSGLPQYGQSTRAPTGGGGYGGGQQCRTEYKTVFDIVETESVVKECKTAYQKKCQTKYENQCRPVTEQKCKTEHRDVCETKYKTECEQQYRQVQEEYEEDVCKDENVRVCDKTWVQVGYNDKVWKEDPSTCKELPKTKCSTVKKTRTKSVPHNVCKNVPVQDCRKVPEQKCENVVRQVCRRVPWKSCSDVPYQKCEDKHLKSPKTVSKRVPVRVCDDGVVIKDDAGSSNDAAVREAEAANVDPGLVTATSSSPRSLDSKAVVFPDSG